MEDFSALSDLQPTSKVGKAIVPAVISLMQEFQEKFMDMFGDLRKDFSKIFQAQDAKISQMGNEINILKLQIGKLEEKIDENNNFERRDALVFSGSAIPNAQNVEVCSELVAGLLKNILKLNISPGDISTSHRLNTRKDILVKFCRHNTKVDIINACRKIKPVNFYANEFLTPQRQTIANVLRKCKKEFPDIISGSTTFDGKNFVWVKPPNPDARGAKTLKKPLTHFISEWTH